MHTYLDLKLTPIIVELPVSRKVNGELYYRYLHIININDVLCM